MKLIDLKKILAGAALGLVTVIGASEAMAQDRDRDDRRDRRDQMNRQQQGDRWRVRRNGRNYELNQSQAELLRQAVNQGYQQGFQAGREDRTNRRRGNYRSSSVYRSGDFGYQSSVDRNLYQYYFQQGFQRGYQDGSTSRYRYGRQEGGNVTIMGNILESILGIRRY